MAICSARSEGGFWLARLLVLIVPICFLFIPAQFKGYAQFAVAPLVFLLMSRVRLFSVRVPVSVVCVGLLGTLLGVLAQFSHVRLSKGAFLVSTVSERDLRQEAKIYRDKLRKGVGQGGAGLVGLRASLITDPQSARSLLDQSGQIAGVIWGGSRWMNVTLKEYDPLSLAAFPEGSVAADILKGFNLPELYLIRSVPQVGLSHGHERGSLHFLSQIIKVWNQVPRVTAPGAASDIFEGQMESLSATQARWTSKAHLALPLFLSANAHLVRSIEGKHILDGDLDCALRQYQYALSLFTAADNPPLALAIRNNYAVARLATADSAVESRAVTREVIKNLRIALSSRKKSPTQGGYMALNFYAFQNSLLERDRNDKK